MLIESEKGNPFTLTATMHRETYKLTCGDGVVLRIRREYFENSVFNNPEIAVADAYTLRCNARSGLVNAVLGVVYGQSQTVTITKDNFEDLRNLCEELGFSGLDEELRAFSSKFGVKHEVEVLEKRFLEHELKLERFEDELRLLKSCVSKLEGLSLKVGSLEKDGGQLRDIFMKRDGIA